MVRMHYGRYKILTDLLPNGDIEHDEKIIPLIITKAMPFHNKNVLDMQRHRDYYFNNTDIFKKEKTTRPDINSMVSKPICQIACIRKNSYCFGKPFQFISAKPNLQDEVQEFNNARIADDYESHLTEATLKSSWASVGYKYVMKPNEDEIEDGMFFKTVTDIDPRQAFCVYENSIDKQKVLGVIFYNAEEYEGEFPNARRKVYTIYNVFTKWHKWVFKCVGGVYQVMPFNVLIGDLPLVLKGFPYRMDSNVKSYEVKPKESSIPLIEFIRNPDRTNDFELAMSLIDASNQIISYAVDKIRQNVDYVIKLKDIDVGEWDDKGNNPVYDRIIRYLQANILPIKSNEGATTQPDASILDVPLDITQVKDLLNFLKQEIYESLFIPTRGEGVGQDTGKAVERRNGFTELEDFAGITVNCAKRSEREFIKVALEIAKEIPNCPFKKLKPKDIIIKDTRNNVEDLQEATTAFATLIGANVNRSTAYEITKLVADAIDTAKLDEIEMEIKQKKAMKLQNQQTSQTKVLNNANNVDKSQKSEQNNNDVIDTTDKK